LAAVEGAQEAFPLTEGVLATALASGAGAPTDDTPQQPIRLAPAEDAIIDDQVKKLVREVRKLVKRRQRKEMVRRLEAVLEHRGGGVLDPNAGAEGREQRELGIVANALLVSARSMINRGELTEAAVKLRKLVTMSPESVVVRELLDSTENDLLKQLASARRADEVQQLSRRVEGLNRDGKEEEAEQLLALAREVYGPGVDIDDLARPQVETTEESADDQVDKHLAAARRALDTDEIRDTIDKLREAGALEPGGARVQELMQETMRRHAVTTVSDYLEQRNVAEAWQSLAVSEKIFGDSDEFDRLRQRLNELTQENTRDAVDALLTSARILLDGGDHRGALQQLRRAGTVDPGNSEVRTLTQETLQRHAEATVAIYLEEGEQEDAKKALSVARKRFTSSLGLMAFDLELSDDVDDQPPQAATVSRKRSLVPGRREAGVRRLRGGRIRPLRRSAAGTRRGRLSRTGKRTSRRRSASRRAVAWRRTRPRG
jgi:uncharacterized protein HemY